MANRSERIVRRPSKQADGPSGEGPGHYAAHALESDLISGYRALNGEAARKQPIRSVGRENRVNVHIEAEKFGPAGPVRTVRGEDLSEAELRAIHEQSGEPLLPPKKNIAQ
jgi:hypothetical protein